MTLKTQGGGIVVIEPNMPTNTARSAYRVCMMSPSHKHGDEDDVKQILGKMSQEKFTSMFAVSQLYSEIAEKLEHLKSRLDVEGLKAVEMMHLNQEIFVLRDCVRQDRLQYENLRHYEQSRTTVYIARKSIADYPKYVFSEETKKKLQEPKFNVWEWEPNEMRSLIEFMYFDLGLVQEFNISPPILKRWMMCVQANYRENPFHNFRHCFCVTQMMYCMIHLCNLKELLTKQDLLILMTASVCHDLDHPGFNNMYQINARTELSIRYNDISPLENHHAAVAFDIFAQPECNIFSNVSRDTFRRVRQEIIMLVLATDMARHSEIVEGFKSKLDHFDFNNHEHLDSLKMMLIKCCDISNEVRPTEVSEPWVDYLLEEYFIQSDREKEEGMTVSPLMDREKATKPKAQIGFIKLVLIPLFETLSKLFTQIDTVMIVPLRKAFDHYEKLRVNEEKPLQRKDTEKARRSISRKKSRHKFQTYGRKSKQQNGHLQENNRMSVQEVNKLDSHVDEKLKSTSVNDAKLEKEKITEKPEDPIGEQETESGSQKSRKDQQEIEKEEEKGDNHTLDSQHGVEKLENEKSCPEQGTKIEAVIVTDKKKERNSDSRQDVENEEEKVTEEQENLEIKIETDEHYNKDTDGEPNFEVEETNRSEQESQNSDSKSEGENQAQTEAGNQEQATIDVKEAKQLDGEMNQASEKDSIKDKHSGKQSEETQNKEEAEPTEKSDVKSSSTG